MAREFLCMIWPLRKATTGDAFKIIFKKDFPHPPMQGYRARSHRGEKGAKRTLQKDGAPSKGCEARFCGEKEE